MSRGCPQGSALGPLLWNVFQNDLSYCLTANLSMYADDHQIYHAGADQAAVTFQLKDSANLATTWYGSNLLAGNLKKYQVLNLGFIQNDNNIFVNNVEIETKDNIIHLGVVLDSKLNFSEHIISICKKASQRIGVLMRLRNLNKNQSSNHQIYHAGADQAAVTFQLKDSANLATTWYGSNLVTNLRQLNISELLDDGCAGCSLRSS